MKVRSYLYLFVFDLVLFRKLTAYTIYIANIVPSVCLMLKGELFVIASTKCVAIYNKRLCSLIDSVSNLLNIKRENDTVAIKSTQI